MSEEKMLAVRIVSHEGAGRLEVREVERPAARAAQAEYVVVPEGHLAEIPEGLTFEAAAAVPEVFVTAHDALFTQAGLRTGERVLIHAVGSGVGTAAAQLARAAGAGAGYGTARTPGKNERARGFGMDDGVVVSDEPRAFTNSVW